MNLRVDIYVQDGDYTSIRHVDFTEEDLLDWAKGYIAGENIFKDLEVTDIQVRSCEL